MAPTRIYKILNRNTEATQYHHSQNFILIIYNSLKSTLKKVKNQLEASDLFFLAQPIQKKIQQNNKN